MECFRGTPYVYAMPFWADLLTLTSYASRRAQKVLRAGDCPRMWSFGRRFPCSSPLALSGSMVVKYQLAVTGPPNPDALLFSEFHVAGSHTSTVICLFLFTSTNSCLPSMSVFPMGRSMRLFRIKARSCRGRCCQESSERQDGGECGQKQCSDPFCEVFHRAMPFRRECVRANSRFGLRCRHE